MATIPQATEACCNSGHHRAKRVPVRAGATTSVCLDCGCRLIRTAASRRWIYSGQLA